MKFAVWGFQSDNEILAHVKNILEYLIERGHKLAVLDTFAEELSLETNGITRLQADNIPSDLDFIVSIGGDGTLLSAAQAVMRYPIPILGINLGSLGFLTGLERDWRHGLDAILKGHYQVEERMVLNCRIEHADGSEETLWALNDVVVERADVMSLLPLEVKVGDHLLNRYQSDGLIVSTPTGSTAYALSAGGPILDPGLDVILITPISAHTLSVRPVVLPDHKRVYIRLMNPKGRANLHIDGKNTREITPTDNIRIRASSYRIQLVIMPDNTFYEKLRKKLHWGHRSA